jgi:hypothetical protein
MRCHMPLSFLMMTFMRVLPHIREQLTEPMP